MKRLLSLAIAMLIILTSAGVISIASDTAPVIIAGNTFKGESVILTYPAYAGYLAAAKTVKVDSTVVPAVNITQTPGKIVIADGGYFTASTIHNITVEAINFADVTVRQYIAPAYSASANLIQGGTFSTTNTPTSPDNMWGYYNEATVVPSINEGKLEHKLSGANSGVRRTDIQLYQDVYLKAGWEYDLNLECYTWYGLSVRLELGNNRNEPAGSIRAALGSDVALGTQSGGRISRKVVSHQDGVARINILLGGQTGSSSIFIQNVVLTGKAVEGYVPPVTNPDAGDIHSDGVINAADATMLRRYLVGDKAAFQAENPDFNPDNTDVNGDGRVDEEDLKLLRLHFSATDPSTVPLGSANAGGYDKSKKPLPDNYKYLIAITFDDGPAIGPISEGNTRGVVNALKKYDARATFFVQGQRVDSESIPLLKEMFELGHDIENHSWDHPDVSGLSRAEQLSQINRTSDAIEAAVGRRPKFFRAPFFASSNMLGLDVATGVHIIHCGYDTNDWDGPTADAIANAFLNGKNWNGQIPPAAEGGYDGRIVLFHDAGGNREQTVASIDKFVPQMQAMGYVFVTVEELYELRNVEPRLVSGNADLGNLFNGTVK